jgi:hypothetical protein
MAARMSDGRTRWEHATEQARALLEQSSPATEVRLLDTSGGSARNLRRARCRDRGARAGAGHRLGADTHAGGLTARRRASALVHRWRRADRDSENAIVHAVFEPADNVAVTAFQARPLAQDRPL